MEAPDDKVAVANYNLKVIGGNYFFNIQERIK